MKKFLIIGNMNAITYKEIFPLIKDNQLWIGVSRNGCGQMYFRIDDDAPQAKGQIVIDGQRMQTIGSSAWFTNLDHQKRHEEIDLYKHYNAEEYPKYENYDAIEVSRIKDIPYDYDGVMGVPISIVLFNPYQFEIIGEANHGKDSEWDLFTPSVDGKTIFKRILIKRVSK